METDCLLFGASPSGTNCLLTFNNLSISAIDFWRRHFLVYDLNFHKLGTCDLKRGVWYFSPVDSPENYMGFTRDDAIKAWLSDLGGVSLVAPCSRQQ